METPEGTLRRVALTRLGLVVAHPGPVSPAVAAAIVAELARVGVRLGNPERLSDGLAADVPELVALVRRSRGEHGSYSPLFGGFPDRLPAVDDGPARLMMGAYRLVVRALERELGEELDELAVRGAVTPAAPQDRLARRLSRLTDADVREAMDFSAFGGWPASSVPQDVTRAELDRAVQSLLPPDGHTEWTTLTLVGPDEVRDRLRDWMTHAFAAPASLRLDVRDDLTALADVLGVAFVDPASVRFRETATLLHALLWRHDPVALRPLGLTPDDVLRLMAQLTGGDVSLATRAGYPRLTRTQRRLVVELLEASPRLADVFRRRGLWLALARGLHLGEYEAPRTREVFARLRASRHDRTSLRARYEAALAAADDATAVGVLGAEAPGLLMRELRRLAARADTPMRRGVLLDAVRRSAGAVPLRVLFAVRAQVQDNGRSYPRVAFTAAGGALRVDGPAGHLAVDDAFAVRLVGALDEGITAAARSKGDLSGVAVWIDPLLDRVLVPDALRTTAQGVVQVERGSRLPLRGAGSGPDAAARPGVLRLFVHWREADRTSDLDLSMMALDDAFELVTQVSWTQLADGAMTHSGDLTSAPAGAEEFIDVRLDDARARPGWRYLVPSVYRFSGPSFNQLPEAVVGWMLRQEASSDRATFDVSTVVNAFALTGSAGTAVPFAVDLKTEEVVYVDLYRRSPWGARVERDGFGIAELLRCVVDRASIKAGVAEVARTVLTARGARLVADRRDAVLSVGLDDGCTLGALRPERLLAELL